jgi:hypothetical protein
MAFLNWSYQANPLTEPHRSFARLLPPTAFRRTNVPRSAKTEFDECVGLFSSIRILMVDQNLQLIG